MFLGIVHREHDHADGRRSADYYGQNLEPLTLHPVDASGNLEIHSEILAAGMQFKIDCKETADYADHADKLRASCCETPTRITDSAV